MLNYGLHTDKQTDNHTDTQTDSHTDTETDRNTGKQHTDTQTNIQTDRLPQVTGKMVIKCPKRSKIS